MPRDLTLIDHIILNFHAECEAIGRRFMGKTVAPVVGLSTVRTAVLIKTLRDEGHLPKRAKPKPPRLPDVKRATKRKMQRRLEAAAVSLR